MKVNELHSTFSHNSINLFLKLTFSLVLITASSRRNMSSYSPSYNSKRRRGNERSYDRSSDYHYSSKRNNEGQNHRHSRERITETYDLTTSSSSSSSRLLGSNRKRRAPHSPSPVRIHSTKRHSRSHSPRNFRSAASPTYYSRSSRAESSSRTARSPTPPSRKIDISDKISDTSLFAELVKDKRKRNKVLQEILDKQEEMTVVSSGENSNSAITNNNNVIVVDSVDSSSSTVVSADTIGQAANGIKEASRMNLVDIPMPSTGEEQRECIASGGLDGTISAQPPLPETILVDETNTVISSNTIIASATKASVNAGVSTTAVIINNSSVELTQQTKLNRASPGAVQGKSATKATYSIAKPKSLTKLPMPPGVNVAELEDITTPSPPRSTSPVGKQIKTNSTASKSHTIASTTKKGLLTLPMPPMVPGSEDLSGDDDYISSPIPVNRSAAGLKHNSSGKKEVKRKRPTILNRRNSRSQAIKDWGERCVDVFEVIAQIGEGTYGQVSFLAFYFLYSNAIPIISLHLM